MRIPKRQEQLDALTRKYLQEPKAEGNGDRTAGPPPDLADEEILALCRKAKNAAKFSDLYDAGNTAAYDGDDSDADLGLLGILKFYTQDPAQLERLFDGSALGERPKWRNRLDYRRRTIDKALSRPGETYTPPKDKSSSANSADQSQERPNPFQRSDLAKALKEGVEPPRVLVPEILLIGKVHSIYSAGGTGKTFYAAYIARKVLERGGSVLYFDQENGLRIMAERAECLGISPKMARNFYHYPFPTMPLDPEVTEAFEQLLDEIGPDLVVFDSWVNHLAMCGLDENSSLDIATWTEVYAQKARHRDIAVLILDHIPKEGGSARGSGRKLDYVDVMWELRNPQPFDRETVGRIDLHLRKDREGWLPRVLTYSVGGGEDGFVFKRSLGTTEPKDEAGLPGKERATLEALEALGSMGAFDREWKAEAESRDVKKSKYYEAKKRLLDLGLVENVMNKFFLKDLQKRSPDESGGVHMDHAGEEVQFGPGGLDPGPTGPPVDEADEGDLFGADKPKCDHGPGDSENPDPVVGIPLSADLAPGESATLDQLRRIRRLVGEGIAERLAREQVLGTGTSDEDNLFGAEPKVVSIESGEPYDVYVGRGKRGTKLEKSKWHNPYVVDKDGTRDECLEMFERYLKASPLMAELPEIKGKILACHCAPKSCHADILLRLANANVSGDSGVGECQHGTPEGYPCEECELDEALGGKS